MLFINTAARQLKALWWGSWCTTPRHTLSHTFRYSLYHILSDIHFITLSHTFWYSLYHSVTYFLIFTLSHTFWYSFYHSITYFLIFTLSHTFRYSLYHILSDIHFITYFLIFTLSHTFWYSLYHILSDIHYVEHSPLYLNWLLNIICIRSRSLPPSGHVKLLFTGQLCDCGRCFSHCYAI